MAMALDMRSADFERRFAALIAAKRESAADVDAAAAAIIEDVRARGDEALAEYSLRFDRVDVAKIGLKIGCRRDRGRDRGLRGSRAQGAEARP